MKRLARYLGRYRLRLAWGITCLVATTTLVMSIPGLQKRAVDGIAHDAGMRRVGGLIAAIIGIAVVQAAVRTFSRYIIFNVGRDVEYDLRNDLFAHLERLPLGFYQERQTGDLMSRLVNDVNAVRMMLGPGLLTFINTPIYYAYGLFLMMRLDWQVTLAALAVYPLTLGVVKRTSRLLMERTLRVQEGLAELSARTQENLAGIHVVKAYACEAREVEDFRERNGRFQVTNMRLAEVRSLIGPVMNVVGGVSTLVVLWMGGMRVMAGTMSVGDIVAFIGYLYLLGWPTMALGWMLSVLQRGRAAMRRLDELFAVEPAIDSPAGATAPGEVRGELCFRDVTFRYGRSATSAPTLDG